MNAIVVITGLVRWTARLLALGMGGGIFLLAVGEGFNPARLTGPELILSVPFFVAWVGLWLGWRWEGLGGMLVVAGVLGFYLVHFAERGRFPAGWAFPLIALPGVLFLTCSVLSGKIHAEPTLS